jgi:hypothetical protein
MQRRITVVLPAQIKYTEKRGFHLVYKTGNAKNGMPPSLPPSFMALQTKSRTERHCTTAELMALNTRLQSASKDCLVLTFQVPSKKGKNK